MNIFKAYDIRGKYPADLNEEFALKLGKAFGLWLKPGSIIVGFDMRSSSPTLAQALIEGLISVGRAVYSIGLCSTPMLNLAVNYYHAAGGIMITASHNPSEYNGFKICREEAIPVSGYTGLKELQILIETNNLNPKNSTNGYTSSLPSFFGCYSANFFNQHKITFGQKPLKLVVDCGNGIAGKFEYEIIKQYFPNTIGLYTEPDGTFPNHEPNPLVESNLDDLRQKVLSEQADAGIAFDGDADRVFFVDETGKTIQGDLLLILMAKYMLKEKPGETVLYDLRSSWAVREEIEQSGGVPILSRVGHSFIKKTLRDKVGLLGGELSGHFYFRDLHYLDVAIYAALKTLEIMTKSSETLSELIKPFDRYPRTGEVNFIVDNNIDEVNSKTLKELGPRGIVTNLDGISIEMPDWWFNLRPSNTEPLLRLNLQAKTQKLLEEKFEFMKTLIGGTIH